MLVLHLAPHPDMVSNLEYSHEASLSRFPFAFSFFFSFSYMCLPSTLLSRHSSPFISSDLKQREAVLALFSASAIDVFTSLIQVSSLSLFSLSPLLPSFSFFPTLSLSLLSFLPLFYSYCLPLSLLISPCPLSSTFLHFYPLYLSHSLFSLLS